METYSRLLVYSEIESLGIKGFLNQLLPKVFVQQSWGTLHTLLEIFSYRLYHIQVFTSGPESDNQCNVMNHPATSLGY